ncbi:MAG: hypothetical protein HLUCCO17_10250 [Saliniramus fredricksonii]|uniref:Uncharacterized protein n=1 Tax=Saliniramus fredricksonii TaxID=1653334 RepID=A0A0P7Y2G7_9HYPH|nr:MAG: hypothetical protein HLUCCO17_10250 [Saliniramus fredricksonii]SCC79317.1 hypothetical protein GA0071312_0805 [Saliniramus fredricksonii]
MSLNDPSVDSSCVSHDGPSEDRHRDDDSSGLQPHAERSALLRALAHRDECLARKRNYAGRSLHVRRKLDAALRAAESDVAILRYALGEAVDGTRAQGGSR